MMLNFTFLSNRTNRECAHEPKVQMIQGLALSIASITVRLVRRARKNAQDTMAILSLQPRFITSVL